MPRTVKKYGGSVLRSREVFEAIAERSKPNEILVVSAPGGKPKMTDLLIEIYETQNVDELKTSYPWIFDEIGEEPIEELRRYLKENNKALVVAFGETLSGLMLERALKRRGKRCSFYPGYEAGIYLDDRGRVLEITDELKKNLRGRVIVGGFIGRNYRTLEPQLMERNGTDITGALCVLASNAKEYIVYKDTAVRRTPEKHSKPVRRLSYSEAIVLGYAGSPVVHPTAIELLKRRGVPIYVRNFFADNEETVISNESGSTPVTPVACITWKRVKGILVQDEELYYPGYLHSFTRFFAERGMNIEQIISIHSSLFLTLDESISEEEIRKAISVKPDKLEIGDYYVITLVGERVPEEYTIIKYLQRYGYLFPSLDEPCITIIVPPEQFKTTLSNIKKWC